VGHFTSGIDGARESPYFPLPKAPEPEPPVLTIDLRAFSVPTLRGIERDLSFAARTALRRRDFKFGGALTAASASVMRALIARARE